MQSWYDAMSSKTTKTEELTVRSMATDHYGCLGKDCTQLHVRAFWICCDADVSIDRDELIIDFLYEENDEQWTGSLDEDRMYTQNVQINSVMFDALEPAQCYSYLPEHSEQFKG